MNSTMIKVKDPLEHPKFRCRLIHDTAKQAAVVFSLCARTNLHGTSTMMFTHRFAMLCPFWRRRFTFDSWPSSSEVRLYCHDPSEIDTARQMAEFIKEELDKKKIRVYMQVQYEELNHDCQDY